MSKSTTTDPDLLKGLLEKVIGWLYNDPYSDNIGEDKTGAIVWEKNHDQDIWCLPGYHNTIAKGQVGKGIPKVTRKIKIPKGKQIFCVVGSSHASKYECRTCLNGDPMDVARHIDTLWKESTLTVDGSNIKPLEKIELEKTVVKLPGVDAYGKQHPIFNNYGDLGYMPGEIELATVANAALVTLDEKKQNPHIIDMKAFTEGDASIKEAAYEVSVRYEIDLI